MDRNDLVHALKQYIGHLSVFGATSRPKVYTHWEIIFFGFLLFNIIMIVFNLYLFLEINKGEIFLVEQNGDVRIETIDRTVLKDTIASFEVREALFKERVVNPPAIPDPSR